MFNYNLVALELFSNVGLRYRTNKRSKITI